MCMTGLICNKFLIFLITYKKKKRISDDVKGIITITSGYPQSVISFISWIIHTVNVLLV